MMPVNLNQIMGMLKGGNPEQIIMNMLNNSAQNNPLMQNILTLAKNKDTAQLEAIARNMTKERGVDFDTEFKNFKQTLGF